MINPTRDVVQWPEEAFKRLVKGEGWRRSLAGAVMNVVREIERLNEKELERGGKGPSWHDEYKDSAWIYAGGMPYELSEGDVICVFSQWGEVSRYPVLLYML